MNLVPARTVDDAKRQLTRIRLTAGIVRENMPRLQALIMEAKSFGDDAILDLNSMHGSQTCHISREITALEHIAARLNLAPNPAARIEVPARELVLA
jgi:hypothetical protein